MGHEVVVCGVWEEGCVAVPAGVVAAVLFDAGFVGLGEVGVEGGYYYYFWCAGWYPWARGGAAEEPEEEEDGCEGGEGIGC